MFMINKLHFIIKLASILLFYNLLWENETCHGVVAEQLEKKKKEMQSCREVMERGPWDWGRCRDGARASAPDTICRDLPIADAVPVSGREGVPESMPQEAE